MMAPRSTSPACTSWKLGPEIHQWFNCLVVLQLARCVGFLITIGEFEFGSLTSLVLSTKSSPVAWSNKQSDSLVIPILSIFMTWADEIYFLAFSSISYIVILWYSAIYISCYIVPNTCCLIFNSQFTFCRTKTSTSVKNLNTGEVRPTDRHYKPRTFWCLALVDLYILHLRHTVSRWFHDISSYTAARFLVVTR